MVISIKLLVSHDLGSIIQIIKETFLWWDNPKILFVLHPNMKKVCMPDLKTYFTLSGMKTHWLSHKNGIWWRNEFLFCERIYIYMNVFLYYCAMCNGAVKGAPRGVVCIGGLTSEGALTIWSRRKTVWPSLRMYYFSLWVHVQTLQLHPFSSQAWMAYYR